jgi:hypothetical protein
MKEDEASETKKKEKKRSVKTAKEQYFMFGKKKLTN